MGNSASSFLVDTNDEAFLFDLLPRRFHESTTAYTISNNNNKKSITYNLPLKKNDILTYSFFQIDKSKLSEFHKKFYSLIVENLIDLKLLDVLEGEDMNYLDYKNMKNSIEWKKFTTEYINIIQNSKIRTGITSYNSITYTKDKPNNYELIFTNLPIDNTSAYILSYKIKNTTVKPTVKLIDEPVENPVDEPVENPGENPVDEPLVNPVENPVENPVVNPVEDPVAEPDYIVVYIEASDPPVIIVDDDSLLSSTVDYSNNLINTAPINTTPIITTPINTTPIDTTPINMNTVKNLRNKPFNNTFKNLINKPINNRFKM